MIGHHFSGDLTGEKFLMSDKCDISNSITRWSHTNNKTREKLNFCQKRDEHFIRYINICNFTVKLYYKLNFAAFVRCSTSMVIYATQETFFFCKCEVCFEPKE